MRDHVVRVKEEEKCLHNDDVVTCIKLNKFFKWRIKILCLLSYWHLHEAEAPRDIEINTLSRNFITTFKKKCSWIGKYWRNFYSSSLNLMKNKFYGNLPPSLAHCSMWLYYSPQKNLPSLIKFLIAMLKNKKNLARLFFPHHWKYRLYLFSQRKSEWKEIWWIKGNLKAAMEFNDFHLKNSLEEEIHLRKE